MLSLFQPINFIQPYFLIIGLLPFFILLFTKVFSSLSASRYCDKNLQYWVVTKPKRTIYKRLYVKNLIPVLAWLLLSISLAGPQIIADQRSTANTVKFDNAVVFVLDISKSMLAQDTYPNRISKAKLVINKILTNTNNYLSSLIVYAHNAHIAIPLTTDPNVILNTLKSIRPNMLPVEGSQYLSALALAQEQLSQSGANSKSIIILSDGDFVLGDLASQAENIKSPVNVVGIGTLEGQAIPNIDGSWLTYKNQAVISQLNEVNLKIIADTFNGKYIRIKSSIEYENIKSIIATKTENSFAKNQSSITVWKQLYHWLLYPAVFLFMISTLRFEKLNINKASQNTKQKSSNLKHTLILAVFSFSSILYSSDSIANSLTDANKQYQIGNYIKAENLYKKISGYQGLIGQANSLYQQKNYSTALNIYTQAIKASVTDNERATALFNLANSYYVIGDYSQAISIYKDTLLYNPDLDKAKINIKYAIVINEKIKRELSLRLGENGKTKAKNITPGTGSRTAAIQEGIDVGNSKLSLSNNDSEKPLYVFNSPQNLVNRLIQRGIKHSIISSPKIDNDTSNTQWNYDYTTINMVELLVRQEKEDDFKLWKRLFEIEQGFPAPVDTPHVKEGVKPW